MKKLVSLALTLVLAFTCTTAFAQTGTVTFDFTDSSKYSIVGTGYQKSLTWEKDNFKISITDNGGSWTDGIQQKTGYIVIYGETSQVEIEALSVKKIKSITFKYDKGGDYAYGFQGVFNSTSKYKANNYSVYPKLVNTTDYDTTSWNLIDDAANSQETLPEDVTLYQAVKIYAVSSTYSPEVASIVINWEAPGTGDATDIALIGALMLVSGFGIVLFARKRALTA